MPRCLSILAVLVLTLNSPYAAAQEPGAQFLKSHCVDCHGERDPEAGLRLDLLMSPDASNSETWSKVADALKNGDMPPEGQTLHPDVRRQILNWIHNRLSEVVRPDRGLRRMNRTEYEHTVHDLLGIDTPLAELLPEDNSVQGFDNVATGLDISSVLMERYLEAANVAFEGTIRRIQPLPAATRRSVLMERKENQESVNKNKGGVIEAEGAFVDFTPGWPPARVDDAHPIEPGIYRCRVAVWPHEPGEHRTLAVAVYVGPLFGDGKRRFMGMFDATGTPDDPRIIEFTTHLEEGHALHILPWVYPEHVTWRDKEEARPGVAIAWAETHGPLDQSFPSESTTKLFGDVDTITMGKGWPIWMRHRKGVTKQFVESSTPEQDAERIIRELVPRAFRRPVEDSLVDQFVDLTLSRLDQGSTFEQAVQAGVAAVLCSPHFLLINQDIDVDNYTLASRLSYFLWSSMPDEELLELAKTGTLSDRKVLHTQVDRMLDNPKSQRFVEHFTGQWLDLRDIEFTTPDGKLYPEYSELLLRSMLAETHGFFRHILDNNLDVMNFIDSDFAILNQRMATHYGIPGVSGHEKFRVVKLPEGSVRGGILTHASVLKVTANGTNTSPVIRGVWMLENILGQPSPPPPAGVPAVEPDIRGATTIREQLALHREHESCNRCHRRIDPPGFALEEFDVIGGHREWYRSLGDQGERVAKTNYRVGPDVEQGGTMSDDRDFANFEEFRQLLIDEPDLFMRNLACKLLIYGCGRPLTPADEVIVTSVVEQTRKEGGGLRDMIHAVVDSEMFLKRP